MRFMREQIATIKDALGIAIDTRHSEYESFREAARDPANMDNKIELQQLAIQRWNDSRRFISLLEVVRAGSQREAIR